MQEHRNEGLDAIDALDAFASTDAIPEVRQARPGNPPRTPWPPRPGHQPEPQPRPERTRPDQARIVAGGAVLSRDLPPGSSPDRPEDWPLTRPLPPPSRVDAPAQSGLVPRPLPRVDASAPRAAIPDRDPSRAQPAPAAPRPAPSRVDAPAQGTPSPRPAARVDAGAGDAVRAGADEFDAQHEMPVPIRTVPARHQGGARPSIAPIPSEEFFRTVRDARKTRLAAGVAANPVLAGAGPTRTPETVEAYRKRGAQLLKRFQREQRQPIDALGFVPKDFAFWLLSLRQGLKAPTWRIYRQASILLLSAFPNEEAQAAIELIENDAPGDRSMATGDPIPATALPAERMTSSRKLKYFRYDEWQRVEAHVRLKNRSETAYVLLDWIRAGLATGLRPSEWKATEIYRGTGDQGEPRTFLFVMNAKATNGRGNGAVRTIDLSDLSEGAVSAIERMSSLGLRSFREGRFDQLQSNCAQILYQASNQLWPRRVNHYALYSCRHQFIANMKALGMANEEISALAGHVVDETAASSYARGRLGWPEDKIVDRPRGVKEEIATVRRRLVLWEERRALATVAKRGPGEIPLPPLPEPPSPAGGYEPSLSRDI